jgi:hypothetical protein
VSRGARHNIFSAIATDRDDEVRRLAAEDRGVLEQRMSHNENFQRPLHFAIRKGRSAMVRLLIELGADPSGADASGFTGAHAATTNDIDRPVMEAIGARPEGPDLLAALALDDVGAAARLWRPPAGSGALHVMAKRGHAPAVRWLLGHGADPNGRWSHWDAEVTPLHLVAFGGHVEVARLLLDGGADPGIRDSKHNSDAAGWADHFGRPALADVIRGR